MTPEANMNPLGLSSQGAASMVGAVSSPASAEPAPAPSIEPTELNNVLRQFKGTWSEFERLHEKYGGDAENFRAMQKAVETWFAEIVTKIPQEAQSTPQPSGY